MRIVDPTSGTAPEDTVAVVAAADGAAGALCGLSNSKPGAHDILAAIGRRLADDHGLGPNGLEAKPSAAVGADPALLDHLAAQYRLAVVAIGD
ncbi:hypothetical protein PH190_23085 [Actinomycetospora straminea]|uniref:UGSC-like domain-containing protein n=2 Tax=Actinomycetospora straminea TaxID=663607 RepID=A0ABP9EDC8_9PSEU|nr:hypothetical protein [Actinomycetospora straminea]MDD7935331.1 hypothetical protein [Actinomycetospora straminea]